MEKYYGFAGLELAVQAPDDRIYENERVLAPFAVSAVEDPHWFRFCFCEALDPPTGTLLTQNAAFWVFSEGDIAVRYIGDTKRSWNNADVRVAHCGKEHPVQVCKCHCSGRLGVKTVLNCMAAEHLVARNDGFVFHSSYIDLQGKGILFTAPSGTGKSTQAALWEQLRGAETVNGDRSAVRVTEAGVEVCGIPFAGSSQICKNVTLPLAAIVYLKQAPVTTIRRLRGAEAFHRVWEGCSVNVWDKEDVSLVSGTVLRVLETVPMFELACTPDESAVLALEGVLRI